MVYPSVSVSAERDGIHAKPTAGAERNPAWNGWEGLNSISNPPDGDKTIPSIPSVGVGAVLGPGELG